MSQDLLLQSLVFNEAKTGLSGVMDEVVREHHPMLIDRNRGKEVALMMALSEVETLVGGYRFDTQSRHEDGEWTLHCPELNLTSDGESFDKALDELVSLAESYAELYLSRVDFYKQTDRATHLPWVLRLALTPADRRRDLFTEPPADVFGGTGSEPRISHGVMVPRHA